MFDFGWTEILLTAVMALILVGPKSLPGMLRDLGRFASQARRAAYDFRDALENMDQPTPPPPQDIKDIKDIQDIKTAEESEKSPKRKTGS